MTTTQSHQFDEAARLAPYGAPYPSGWYHLVDVAELRPGKPVAVDALGRNLVVYRGASGQVVVADAHCPHMGASLAGGSVDGDSVVCPFHGWKFGAGGELQEIPARCKLPRARLRTWPAREVCGMVWMYHHVSGERVEPPYEPPAFDDLSMGALQYRGAYDGGHVRMHLREFAENSVDFQHFGFLHDGLTIPWTQIRLPGFGIHHRPSWELDPELPHVAYFSNTASVTFRGVDHPESGAHARVTLFGPGGTVWFRFQLPEVGEIHLFQTHLPVGPLNQRVRFKWWAEPRIPRLLVWYVIGHWISQWRADVPVWENKVFVERPILVAADGPVHRMRRWYRQFQDEEARLALAV